MKNTQIVAERIKVQAKQKGISVKKTLESCELGVNTVTKMANGTDIFSQNLLKVADYLECSVDYLLGRTDNPNITGDTLPVKHVAEPQDEMTTELLKAFKTMSFSDKMEIMNAVLEKSKKSPSSIHQTTYNVRTAARRGSNGKEDSVSTEKMTQEEINKWLNLETAGDDDL